MTSIEASNPMIPSTNLNGPLSSCSKVIHSGTLPS